MVISTVTDLEGPWGAPWGVPASGGGGRCPYARVIELKDKGR